MAAPPSVKMGEAASSDCDDYLDSDDYSYGGSASDGDALGLDVERPGSTARPEKPWRVIDTATLQKVQSEAVAEVCAVWACKASVARTMLMFYMWDKEKLGNDLAERGTEWVYKAAGVAEPGSASSSSTAGPADPSEQVACEVCMCACPQGQCSTNSCGHRFCNDCWSSHLSVQIQDGKARHVSCMAFKCGVVCDEELVAAVMKDNEQLLAKYRQSHLESYMEDNQRVQFCPGAPWCGRAIEVDSDPYVEPECECGVAFCFKCLKAPHSPCTCQMWAMWEEKTSGDSETRNWLAANTKPCPKCSKPVEKNGGCNLVVCQCGQPFCWLCGCATGVRHTWTQIENHSCGRYKDEADARINDAMRNHKRYMWYFERFTQHRDSLAKEKNNRSKLTGRIASAEHEGTDSRDFSWLLRALDQLGRARQVLSNSYAFAYFFFGGQLYADEFSAEQNKVNQNLFEDNQEMLAAEVERLSGLVERARELALDPELRLATINSSVNINSRIHKFFELVENDLYAKLQSCPAQIAVYRGLD